MPSKTSAKLALGLALAALFLWLFASQVHWPEVMAAFAGTRPEWVVAALVAFGAGYAIRIERWRLMLLGVNPSLGWSRAAGPFMASFAANNVLPLRAGDLMRVFAFGRQLGAAPGAVAMTLVVERLLDLFVVLAFLGLALAAFGLEASALAGVGGAALLGLALGLAAFLAFPRTLAPLLTRIGRMTARLSPRLGQRLEEETQGALVTLEGLAGRRSMGRLLGLSLAAWAAEGLVFWSAAQAISGLAAPAAAWLALPVGTLATLIPSTPGYVGTFDFFVARAMALGGNGEAAAAAFALLVHMILWLPPTIVGGTWFLLHHFRLPSKPKASQP